MYRKLVFGLVAAISPAFGQAIYKCHGPDSRPYYQQSPCPQGARMAIQDNGSGSGADADAGLRPSERQALDGIKQREETARQEATRSAVPPSPVTSPYARSPAHDGLERIIRESDATIRSLNRQLGRRR